MKTVLVAFGTRPEAIKMCELIKELKNRAEFNVKVLVTGQHRGMLKQALTDYGITPDYDLDIMKIGQTLSYITAEVLDGADGIISKLLPDIVLVHGDTSSAFAVALAAFYRGVAVGHIEAGLRTHDIKTPFPEEFNRTAISLIAKYHFAPNCNAKNNLLSEGIADENIFVTGNTVIDALIKDIRADYKSRYTELAAGRRLVILTAHRRENISDFESVFRAVKRATELYGDICVIYPVHKNEKILSLAEKVFFGVPCVYLCEPISAFDFHNLLNAAHLILTDSGGVQEEASYLSKPTLVLRKSTERKELLSNSQFKLVGTEEDTVFLAIKEMLDKSTDDLQGREKTHILGDGCAAVRIADILEKIQDFEETEKKYV